MLRTVVLQAPATRAAEPVGEGELPGGLQHRLPLLARRRDDLSAPLPAHVLQSWKLLGFEHDRFEPIENAPKG